MVQLSSMSSQAWPMPGIWRKWSITHRLSKPASSAAVAISRSRVPISDGPPAQVNRGSCNPKRIGPTPASEPAAPPTAADAVSASGTSATGPGGWTAAKPSDSSAICTAGQPFSWAVTTAAGTLASRARFRARTSAAGVSKAIA